VYRHHRVEQVGQSNAVGLGYQPEHRTIAIEAPGAPRGDDFQPGLRITVEDLLTNLAEGWYRDNVSKPILA